CYSSHLHNPSLFLHYSGAPPNLHSFPTRRSSDLPPVSINSGMASATRSAVAGPRPIRKSRIFEVRSPVMRPPSREDGAELRASRSEEHTSELQSRENLVCRLLLEKKKKHQMRIHP